MISTYKHRFIKRLLLFTFSICAISVSVLGNVENYIDIIGSSFYLAVGKSNTVFCVDYNCNGTIRDSSFYVADGNTVISESTINQLLIIDKMPSTEKELTINASIYYTTEENGQTQPHYLSSTKTIYVRKPNLSANREGIDFNHTAEGTAPIHWNIDNDCLDVMCNSLFNEDYRKISKSSILDDDLYKIHVWITNTELDTTDCNLKISVPSALHLWKNRFKDGYWSINGSDIEIKNCDIKEWFIDNAFTNLYTEWVVHPDVCTDARIIFYCNDVEFATLKYKGYAATIGRQPYPLERQALDAICELKGCQWCILGESAIDCNSISESVDEQWSVYGEPFVATDETPLCPNINTLITMIYNSCPCRCISMDTFGNRDLTFDVDSDAEAFFASAIWPENFLKNNNVSIFASDLIYYSGSHAARKVSNDLRVNCFASWAMFKSRFFNLPKMLHRPYQLGANMTILHHYVICPTIEPIE